MKGKRAKIMVFGTFDGLHKGHEHFFGQARALTDIPFLIVSVARDSNVARIKGQRPSLDENERVNLIKRSGLADKVVLGGIKNHLPHIIKEKPDILALGYDQTEYVKNLKNDLGDKGLKFKIFRLKPHKVHIYKNRLLKSKKQL